MYVWVDALINYLTGVGYPGRRGRDVQALVAVRSPWSSAKDIVRFHAVYWPGLPDVGRHRGGRVTSSATAFLFQPRREDVEVGGQRHRSPSRLADAYGVGPAPLFSFLREVPFGQDGNYSHDAIVARINADLANGVGNLAQAVRSP